MHKSIQTDNADQHDKDKNNWRERRWFQITAAIVGLSVVISALILTGRWFHAQDIPQFVTGNLINTLIFVAIVAQVLIYRKQRDIMADQRQAMREQRQTTIDQLNAMIDQRMEMKSQTKAMMLQAESASSMVKQSHEALRISQRAYIGLRDHPRLVHSISSGKNPTVAIQFFNAGNTPARDVEFRYKFEANGVEKHYIARKANFTIFAGATKKILCRWNGQTFSNETEQWFKDGYYQLFFRGKLTYKDAWGVPQEPIKFYYFSINDMDLREDYEGDPDYRWPEFEFEIDADEEVTYSTDWEEPPEAREDPFDF